MLYYKMINEKEHDTVDGEPLSDCPFCGLPNWNAFDEGCDHIDEIIDNE